MNRFILIYTCSLAVAISSFAQAPTASPLTNTPAATTAISPTSTPQSKVEQSVRKKQKKHFNFTIDDHDTDFEKSKDIPAMVIPLRSEEHTSELQSRFDLVCRLLLEKK